MHGHRRKTWLYGLSSFFLLLITLHTHAAEAPVRAELISEPTSIQPGKPFWVAVHFQLSPGWHIYWKNPGATGLPTRIEWALPDDFKAGPVLEPSPLRFDTAGIASYGYKESAVFLAEITAPETLEIDSTVTIRATAHWLACEGSCIPGSTELRLTVPVSDTMGENNAQHTQLFEQARAALPQPPPANWEGVAYEELGEITLLLKTKDTTQSIRPQDPYFFSSDDAIDPEATQQVFELSDGGLMIKLVSTPGMKMQRLSGILTSSSSWMGSSKGIAINLPMSEAPSAAVSSTHGGSSSIPDLPKSLWQMLLFAFIGGIILNAMPCVFPVIGIKMLSFVQQAGDSAWKIKAHGFIFTLGVWISFCALASLLIALKAAGEEIGWGFQLQNATFVAGLCVLLWLVALNFLEVYSVGNTFVGTGHSLAARSGYTGSFFSGVLATLVATPCTAPFMGTAVGFAVLQTPIVTLSIFSSMALGMAFPYLLMSLFPWLINHLPKPGKWMETFRQAMAFPLIASVIWLLWVFGQQTNINALAKLLFALLLVSMAVWVFGRWADPMRRACVQRRGIFSTSILLASGLLLGYFAANPETEENPWMLDWEPYSQETLEALRAKECMVFVDFTAAWCLTCQVNKHTALHNEKVIHAFRQWDVATLQADWTNRDPEITRTLERFGRNGVPLYLLYPKGPDTEPIILPEILTPSIVLDALKKAQGHHAGE